jgi:hypothetical protein|tara:strand:+ start:2915 stop:3169 length:255 start_codon:yes stop_codon:yes gene_type:complete
MLSIAEIIDKLIIENMKIFSLREQIHKEDISDEEYVECENKMNILNENRGTLMDFLNNKIDTVLSGEEKNQALRNIKTYAKSKN